LTTTVDEGRHLLIRNPPENLGPKLDVRNRVVEHEVAHHFEHLDGASLGFLAGSQQCITPLLGLRVDAGNDLVLRFYDSIGCLCQRGLEKAQQHGVALRWLEPPQAPGIVAVAPAGQESPCRWVNIG